jgi:hypothetical protein
MDRFLLTVQPHQLVRPSGHSLVILASHVSFLLCLATAVRRRQLLEAASLALSATISFCYHLCDENIACPLGWSVFAWHALDVWSTFFLVCFVLGVLVLDFDTRRARVLARAAYFALVSGCVWYDRGSMLLFGGLLASVAAAVLFRYGVQRHHQQRHQRRARRFHIRKLVTGLAIFGVSLGCFVVANTPVVGPVTYDAARDGAVKRMDVPDTAVYWFFHAVWHFASAISAHFILQFRD